MAKKKPELYTLADWEIKNQELTIQSIREWILENNLSPRKTKENIEDFRLRMLAGGNLYADFSAAFKVWFRKGWLTYTVPQAKIPDSQLQNRYYDKGINL